MKYWGSLNKSENSNEHSENIPNIFANCRSLTLGTDIVNAMCFSDAEMFGVSLLLL